MPQIHTIREHDTGDKNRFRSKGKDHNSQTQQYFIKFLKYVNNNMPILLLIYFKNFIKHCCV